MLDGNELQIVFRGRSFKGSWRIHDHGVVDGEAVADSSKRASTDDPDANDSALEMIRLAWNTLFGLSLQ